MLYNINNYFISKKQLKINPPITHNTHVVTTKGKSLAYNIYILIPFLSNSKFNIFKLYFLTFFYISKSLSVCNTL